MNTTKGLLLFTIMVSTLCFYSCDFTRDEPLIEGGSDKYFDYKAQTKSFRVVQTSGKPYNHKMNWDIIGIEDFGQPNSTFLTQKVDTLLNGDLKIGYEWVSFLVKNDKSIIEVEVLENTTGKHRSVFFTTRTTGKQIYRPNMLITQKPK
ncbi:MAG: hypothetical protein Q4A64_08850 [Porphyromonadaceae bacterium]|nr:hypothetical protein [Porphyromonadaceae bacterium]